MLERGKEKFVRDNEKFERRIQMFEIYKEKFVETKELEKPIEKFENE